MYTALFFLFKLHAIMVILCDFLLFWQQLLYETHRENPPSSNKLATD